MNQEKLNYIIGKNIKKYRKLYKNNDINMTQEKLAELINVSVSHISSLESNKTKKGISLTNLYKISIVLGVPIHKFLEDNENE
jgi:transcriptional regulator with XRE-family HTH domain